MSRALAGRSRHSSPQRSSTRHEGSSSFAAGPSTCSAAASRCEVQRQCQLIASLTRELQARVGIGANVNLYCTPGGAPGAALHVDDHDVVVLQLAGEKLWSFVADDGARSECVVRPGDLLLVPSPLQHTTRTSGEALSLHLSLHGDTKVRAPSRAWLDDVKAVMAELANRSNE